MRHILSVRVSKATQIALTEVAGVKFELGTRLLKVP